MASRWPAWAALLIVLGGCLGQGPAAVPPSACASFSTCALGPGTDPLAVVLHRHVNATIHAATLEVLVREIIFLAERSASWSEGSAAATVPRNPTDADLRGLHRPDAVPMSLHIYILSNATYMVGAEPASGISYPGEPMVFLFPETMDFRVAQTALDPEASQAVRQRLEAIVAVHEFGHALGLVGCGIPMVGPHDEPGMACHSSNPASIMHARVARVAEWPSWDAQTALSPFDWDSDDLADIQALRQGLGASGSTTN